MSEVNPLKRVKSPEHKRAIRRSLSALFFFLLVQIGPVFYHHDTSEPSKLSWYSLITSQFISPYSMVLFFIMSMKAAKFEIPVTTFKTALLYRLTFLFVTFVGCSGFGSKYLIDSYVLSRLTTFSKYILYGAWFHAGCYFTYDIIKFYIHRGESSSGPQIKEANELTSLQKEMSLLHSKMLITSIMLYIIITFIVIFRDNLTVAAIAMTAFFPLLGVIRIYGLRFQVLRGTSYKVELAARLGGVIGYLFITVGMIAATIIIYINPNGSPIKPIYRFLYVIYTIEALALTTCFFTELLKFRRNRSSFEELQARISAENQPSSELDFKQPQQEESQPLMKDNSPV